MSKYSLKFLMSSIPLITLGMLVATGCGQKGIRLTGDEAKAFDSAPGEIKQIWDKALAADKVNDYVNAQNLLDHLKSMDLNSQQSQALDTELAAFQQRLMQAVEKNDPSATKAILEINKSKTRR